MKRTRAEALALVNWRGVFYARYELDPHVTALEGANGAGKTTVMIAAYVVLLPDMSRLRFTNLGETGSTGGDKGIWGRLGELGRPSYAAMEFALPKKERWVAGVHLERHAEPSVESTPFIITGLPPEVRLQELLLLRQGETEVVPELNELRENAARLGAQLKVFNTARDYFGMLFEHGVIPLRLSSDEEKNKLNEMLRTSMTGGISRALTNELRDFVLRAEGGLEDQLRNTRANLDACRRTRTELREWRELEEEIGGVFEAGHAMFFAAYLATRERAEELMQRVAEAEAAHVSARETSDRAEAALAEVVARLHAIDTRRGELAQIVAEWKSREAKMRDALAAFSELSRCANSLLLEERSLAEARGELEARERQRVQMRARARSAREAYERAATGLADQQRGLDELHRRAAAHAQVTRRRREAEAALGIALDPESLPTLEPTLENVRRELESVDEQRREVKTRLADAEAHRERYAHVLEAVAAFQGALGEPHAAGLEALRRHREAEGIAARLPEVERDLGEARRVSARQQKVHARADALGVSVGEGAAARLLEALEAAEAERVRHERGEREAELEVSAHERRRIELEAEKKFLGARDDRWPVLDDIARRLGASDRQSLEEKRRVLLDRQATLLRRGDALRAEGDDLLVEARTLLASSGPFPPELIALKDKLEGELVASLFEEEPPADAALWEARLGGLSLAIVVDEPAAAVKRLGDRPDALRDVLLVARDTDIRALAPALDHAHDARDIVVEDGQATRVSRIPMAPRLGRRARQERAAELKAAAEEKAHELAEARKQQRQLDRLTAESEVLLVEMTTWLQGDPGPALSRVSSMLLEVEAGLKLGRAMTRQHREERARIEPRVAGLRALLAESSLLEPPHHGERVLTLEADRKAAREARDWASARVGQARLIESGLDLLRRPPLSDAECANLEARLREWTARRERLDAGIEALAYVSAQREALAWSDAAAQLAADASLLETLEKQVRAAEAARREAEGRSDLADHELAEASGRFHERHATWRVANERHEVARVRFVEFDLPTPSEEALVALTEALGRFEGEARDIEPRRDALLSEHGACRTTLVEAQARAEAAELRLSEQRREADPAVARWDELRERARELGLASGEPPERLAGIRGTPNLHQIAQTQRMILRERLGKARGGEELAAAMEHRSDGTSHDDYLELWLSVRTWLHRRLPAHVAEVDDPREALARFRDQLVTLNERLQRQEAELRGNSEDIATGISTQVRKARQQIKNLNKHLAEIAFGGISAIRIQTFKDDKMEGVLTALKEGAAQGLMFQSEAPFEEALDEIFRRFGGGRAGGTQLLDYRQYLKLQVEVRRRSSTQWEIANPTRLSTGEAIGVGAALMMVVLTEWERFATALRGKRAHGSLRFLFLDEANRLSPDNLGVLFDLCRTLELQLLIASPEVARAEGNTTYRLVRTLAVDGQEDVKVSGRRTLE